MAAVKKGDHKFYIGDDEQNPEAEITFDTSDEGHIIITHTKVSEELRGQGVAGKLVDEVVNFARREEKKIKPACSYAKNKMERTPEYRDILV
ncbi:MAG: GNAT family N-acetyltransferase [Bacillota bacterium]|uniref:GNAT family N-acetyltransferase n=1 Tax=Virgibacillus sp. AGTR TaxID=2812055 RepID=UPI0019646E14|nr:GNAT family N-acetyltransferase [Virgibacillus sp. AGTR]MCC2251094.1 N-acetyltransferase [Virgibacillus sp. AGTR]QRZ19904.1 N-acetyltransferase [Virgibacillus sp. AGTR]